MSEAPVFAALETLVAKRWDIWRAKIFGKKIVVTDGCCVVTMYRWRGKTYLTKCTENQQ